MPCRWVICPWDEVIDEEGRTVRVPRVEAILDAGSNRSGRALVHSTVDLGTFALSLVHGQSLVNLAADSSIVDLLEQDFTKSQRLAVLRSPVNTLGWNNPKRNRVINRISSRGFSTTGLTNSSILKEYVARIGRAAHPDFDAENHNTTARLVDALGETIGMAD